MEFLYSLCLKFYSVLLGIVSVFHKKANLMINGRKNSIERLKELSARGEKDKSVWFHFASLGEFEQGRSVLEQFKIEHPNFKIYITFYSPSGYEIRKNTDLADEVFYLPADTASNAKLLIKALKPSLIFFTKYEYWHFYFKEAHKNSIPLFMISSIFRQDQIFFKNYGGFFRKILEKVSFFFVQNQESIDLLKTIGFQNALVTGDTRFDRVLDISSHPKQVPFVEEFVDNSLTLVAGSTWLEDEKKLVALRAQNPDVKFIIAPHEVHSSRISELKNLFEGAVLYSEAKEKSENISSYSTLIIDNIGMLSSLYQYADITYIGGGFGAGIHNTLEAAAYGKPVIFGPNYSKFSEAKELIKRGGGFSFQNETELLSIFSKLESSDTRIKRSEISRNYILESAGATLKIMNKIQSHLPRTIQQQ